MLRLVGPPTGGQGPRVPKGKRSPGLMLTAEESRHLRVALKNLRWAYGTWACLAEVMGIRSFALQDVASGKSPGSAAMALRAAQAAGMHVETLLSGALSPAGRCATCGSRVGDRAVSSALRGATPT